MNIDTIYRFKKLAIGLVILLAGMAGFYSYIKNLDTLSVTTKVLESIKEKTGVTATVENVHFERFPYPAVKLTRVSTDSGIFIDVAYLNLDILSLFTKNPTATGLSIQNLYVNPKKTGLGSITYHESIRKASEMELPLNKLSIGKIWDTAVTNRVIGDNILIKKSSRDISIEFELKHNIKYKDSISYNSSKNTWDSQIYISNSSINLTIDNSFNDKQVTSGLIKGKISNISNFVRDISPYFDFIINNNIKSSEPVTISGEIINTQDSVVINNISLKSKNLEAIANYWFATSDKDIDILDIKLNKADIANLANGADTNEKVEEPIFKLDTTRLSILVEANSITGANETFNELKLNSIGDGSIFKIISCAGKIASGGDFEVSGQITHNLYRPKFEGKVVINHTNINEWVSKTNFANYVSKTPSSLYLESELVATPIDFRMQNFKMNIGHENISGNADLKIIGNTTQLIGNLNFENLDLENSTAPFTKNIYEYVKSLGLNMSDDSYSSKFITLRTFPLKSTLDLNIDGFKADGYNLNRVSMVMSYDSGQLKIDNFLINYDENTFVKGEGKLIATGLKPNVKFNITDGQINFEPLTKDKIDLFIDYTKANLNISNITFDTTGKLSQLKIGDLVLNDISFAAQNLTGILTISELNFTPIGGGSVASNGNIVFNPIRLNLACGLDTIDIDQVLNTMLPEQHPFLSGFVSINADISASGTSATELFNNLYITGDYAAKDVKISGINISDFIEKVSTPNFDFTTVTQAFTNSATTGETDFDKINGNYQLNNGILSIKDTAYAAKEFIGSVGVTINMNDETIDLLALYLFYPFGARISDPKLVPPVKISLVGKGNLFKPDKLLQFVDPNAIFRIQDLIRPQNYAPQNVYQQYNPQQYNNQQPEQYNPAFR